MNSIWQEHCIEQTEAAWDEFSALWEKEIRRELCIGLSAETTEIAKDYEWELFLEQRNVDRR